MSALVETSGLRAGYGNVEIVRGLDLAIEPGEVVAVLGPNGAGKTTTLLTLSGELEPLGGDVERARLSRPHPAARPRPEGARARLPGTLGPHEPDRRGEPPREPVRRRTRRSNCSPSSSLTSAGESGCSRAANSRCWRWREGSRGARACCWSTSSRLGLAPLIVERLLGVVRAAADDGVGVLLVEQHVHKAMDVADRVLVMRRGAIALAGRADELRDRTDDIRDAYMSTTDSGGNNGDDSTPRHDAPQGRRGDAAAGGIRRLVQRRQQDRERGRDQRG